METRAPPQACLLSRLTAAALTSEPEAHGDKRCILFEPHVDPFTLSAYSAAFGREQSSARACIEYVPCMS